MYADLDHFEQSVRSMVDHARLFPGVSWQTSARVSQHFSSLSEFIFWCRQLGQTQLVSHGQYVLAVLDYGNDCILAIQCEPLDEEDWSALGAPDDRSFGVSWELPPRYQDNATTV